MRHGQLANQGFIYIMAGVIFSLVLIFGYKAIDSLNRDAKNVEMVNLKKDLQSSIRDIASSQGQVKKEFSIPSGHDKICFVDMTEGGANCAAGSNNFCDNMCHPQSDGSVPEIICNMWEDNVTHNIFLIPLAEIPISTARIEVFNESGAEVGAYCMDVSSRDIKVRLKGKGNRAEIHPLYE